jgi:hypothetical protein
MECVGSSHLKRITLDTPLIPTILEKRGASTRKMKYKKDVLVRFLNICKYGTSYGLKTNKYEGGQSARYLSRDCQTGGGMEGGIEL